MTIQSAKKNALKESNYKDLELEIQRTNVADENRSDPCGCWCAFYSKEGDGRKLQESIIERYCDRDPKDLHAEICTNPREGGLGYKQNDWLEWLLLQVNGLRLADAKKNTSKDCDRRDNNDNSNDDDDDDDDDDDEDDDDDYKSQVTI